MQTRGCHDDELTRFAGGGFNGEAAVDAGDAAKVIDVEAEVVGDKGPRPAHGLAL